MIRHLTDDVFSQVSVKPDDDSDVIEDRIDDQNRFEAAEVNYQVPDKAEDQERGN
jgi:hypothetical protein